ncbi:hypothetical protein HDU76_010362 [Blyttiomyces sp. JEL0837]|nr:hypothetical protein HDU76_010362 [Blyttiomyces sp. JEL0837]
MHQIETTISYDNNLLSQPFILTIIPTVFIILAVSLFLTSGLWNRIKTLMDGHRVGYIPVSRDNVETSVLNDSGTSSTSTKEGQPPMILAGMMTVDCCLRAIVVGLTAVMCYLFFDMLVLGSTSTNDMGHGIHFAELKNLFVWNAVAGILAFAAAIITTTLSNPTTLTEPPLSNTLLTYETLIAASFTIEYTRLQGIISNIVHDGNIEKEYLISLESIVFWIAMLACGIIVVDVFRRFVAFQSEVEFESGLKGCEMRSPETSSSFLSMLTFSWLNPLIRKGMKRPITSDDVYKLPIIDTTEVVLEKYKKVKAVKGICDSQKYFYSRRVAIQFGNVLQSEIFAKALRRAGGVGGGGNGKKQGDVKVDEKTDGGGDDEKKEEEEATLGKIVTLLSVDCEKVLDYITFSTHLFIKIPISFVLAFAGLYQILGVSSLAGVVYVLAIMPLTASLGKWASNVQTTLMGSTDKRVNQTNEVLNGIRIIKYFGWEDQFAAKILAIRETELYNNLKMNLLEAVTFLFSFSSSIICFFLTFFTYTVIAGNTLDAATAFTAVVLLQQFSDLLSWSPQEFIMALNAWVSLKRIEGFLEERDMDQFLDLGGDDGSEDFDENEVGVEIWKGSFRYYTGNDAKKTDGKMKQGGDETESLLGNGGDGVDGNGYGTRNNDGFNLRDVNVEFVLGGLNVVSGPTGSGKSSLVLALLGEMKKLAGKVNLPKSSKGEIQQGAVAYVAQTAWLLNDTIRENILFGSAYDEERYRRVIHACALVRDLETFPGGDLTEIGEKGISLSGGQKQRVSLARALYSNAPIVLLDDPLSAVDAPTARHLMRNAILTEMKGRTVVLVTHAISLSVQHADHIIILKNGEILAQGTPAAIAANPLVKEITSNNVTKESTDEDQDIPVAAPGDADGVDPMKKDVVANKEDGTKIVTKETVATGSVKWEVYADYLQAMGIGMFSLVLLFLVGENAVGFGTDWWLAYWTNAIKNNETLANTSMVGNVRAAGIDENVQQNGGSHSMVYYIGIYGLFGMGKVLNQLFLSVASSFAVFEASQTMHKKLLDSVLGAPLRFFETTPLGRILNRFSADIGAVDSMITMSVVHLLTCVFKVTTIIVVISLVSPMFVLAFIPIAFLYNYYQQIYLSTSRELKRLHSVSRSPIFSMFSETLNGVTTIRAFGQSKRFISLYYEKLNNYYENAYLLFTSNRWMFVRCDILSAIFVLAAGVTVISGDISPGFAGIVLVYASEFSQYMLFTLAQYSRVELSMNAAERCREYSQIKKEGDWVVDGYRPSPNWPDKGKVVVRNLAVRYSEDTPVVLKNISFETKPGERIGVVGRTGAGKSTLSLAFFRILPWADGSINIDGMDINRMGLHDLRQALTIIPQDPVLFTGTVRSNLDPLGEWDDANLWRVLKSTHILDSFQVDTVAGSSAEQSVENTLANGNFSLDSAVAENGGNFSQGQRQLLCLARALLRKGRLIFFDEATASIDAATDERIQRTIREELTDATIFCIAHRLRTVIDFDRILVLDQGEIVEFGTPVELLLNSKAGHLRRMCELSGEMDLLLSIAQAAASNTNSFDKVTGTTTWQAQKLLKAPRRIHSRQMMGRADDLEMKVEEINKKVSPTDEDLTLRQSLQREWDEITVLTKDVKKVEY